ncbi:MAG: thiamine pyrophosphate-binding protein [Pigmentiphaga sp.]|nr:thiamine pyrophosphate-binding protein [Pigmentiphaga sp.]
MRNAAIEALHVLKANGIHRIFGNPGTTELPLLDGIVSEGFDFYLGLNEAVVTAMADGHARATRRPSVVLVHTAVGAANTLMGLINAQADRSPLVVIAGDKDDLLYGRGHFVEVPDIGGLVRQTCKASWRVSRPEKLPELVLRALKIAQTPPRGPVFISVPQNYLAELIATQHENPARAAAIPLPRPARSDIEAVLASLRGARRPLIIAGNEAGYAGKAGELRQLCEHFGAAAVTEQGFTASALNFPSASEHYHGPFSPSLRVVRDADLIVAIGARLFMEYDVPRESPFPPGAPLIQIDSDPAELGKIYAASRLVLADPGLFIDELLAAGRRSTEASQMPGVTEASELAKVSHTSAASKLTGTPEVFESSESPGMSRLTGPLEPSMPPEPSERPSAAGGRPVRWWARETKASDLPVAATPSGAGMRLPQMIQALQRALPPDTVIVDESVGSKGALHEHFRFTEQHGYFGTCSGGLGWGMGAALGVQLALPERPVLAFLGDGASLFTIQALWTAAKFNLPVVFCIVNNGGYLEVRKGLGRFDGEAARRNQYPGAWLDQPVARFVSLAQGFGVDAERCEDEAALEAAVQRALSRRRPYLIDVHLDSAQYF